MKGILDARWLDVKKFSTNYINRAIEKGKTSNKYIEIKLVDDKNKS